MKIIGRMTDNRRRLDKKHLDTKKKVREAAKNLSRERVEREQVNIIYAYNQAWFSPKLNELKGKGIDVFWPMDDDDARGTKYQWCQGVVVNNISNDPPTVNVWCAMPYIEGFEESS